MYHIYGCEPLVLRPAGVTMETSSPAGRAKEMPVPIDRYLLLSFSVTRLA